MILHKVIKCTIIAVNIQSYKKKGQKIMNKIKDFWESYDAVTRKALCIALSLIMLFSSGYLVGALSSENPVSAPAEQTVQADATVSPEQTTAAPEQTTAAPEQTTAPQETTVADETKAQETTTSSANASTSDTASNSTSNGTVQTGSSAHAGILAVVMLSGAFVAFMVYRKKVTE